MCDEPRAGLPRAEDQPAGQGAGAQHDDQRDGDEECRHDPCSPAIWRNRAGLALPVRTEASVVQFNITRINESTKYQYIYVGCFRRQRIPPCRPRLACEVPARCSRGCDLNRNRTIALEVTLSTASAIGSAIIGHRLCYVEGMSNPLEESAGRQLPCVVPAAARP